MQLKFLALPHAKVAERHVDGASMARPHHGGAFRYVGWKFDPNAPGHAVVSAEPHACDSESAEAEYLAKCCRNGDLSPADDATAKFCGVALQKPTKTAPSSAKDGS